MVVDEVNFANGPPQRDLVGRGDRRPRSSIRELFYRSSRPHEGNLEHLAAGLEERQALTFAANCSNAASSSSAISTAST